MKGERKVDQLERAQRVRKLERFILLGLTLEEMGQRLGVSRRTIQRDLEHRIDTWLGGAERAAQNYRQSILAELGNLYAEQTQDAIKARTDGRDTYQYAGARVNILHMIARLTGAEAPFRVEHSGSVERQLTVITESDLRRLAEVRCEIEAELVA